MGVVGRQTKLAVFLQVDVVLGEDQQALQHGLAMCLVEAQRLVGIGEKGGGGSDDRDFGAGTSEGCAQEEGDVAFHGDAVGAGGLQTQRIEARSPVGGDRQVQVGRPAAVQHVVVMEMDCAVFLGRLGPALRPAGPVGAGHGAHRHLAERSVQPVGGPVVDDLGFHTDGEVPGRDQRRVAGVRDDTLTKQPQRINGQWRGIQPGAVDLAIEMGDGLPGLVVQMGGDDQGARRGAIAERGREWDFCRVGPVAATLSVERDLEH